MEIPMHYRSFKMSVLLASSENRLIRRYFRHKMSVVYLLVVFLLLFSCSVLNNKACFSALVLLRFMWLLLVGAALSSTIYGE